MLAWPQRAPAQPKVVAPPRSRRTLDRLGIGREARVEALHLERAELDWVRAVGIFEGERLRVLRRAVFGGPLHVRTRSGGEFALDRRLAARIAAVAVFQTAHAFGL